MAVETTPAPAHGKLYQGVEKDAFGYRMMSAMGWAEGKVRLWHELPRTGSALAAIDHRDSLMSGASTGPWREGKWHHEARCSQKACRSHGCALPPLVEPAWPGGRRQPAAVFSAAPAVAAKAA